VGLEMLQHLNSDDSDAGHLSEVETDSDFSWVDENTSGFKTHTEEKIGSYFH